MTLTVKDLMTKPVVAIRNSTTVENAILLMRAQRVRSLIVEPANATDTYGIITEKDIVFQVVAVGKDPERVLVREIMRHPCIQIPPHLTVQEAAQTLADAGIHRAPVIERGELLGILSVTDILHRGYPGPVAKDELTRHILEALQHARIIDDEEAQMKQECDLAWQILEELRQAQKAAS